MPELKENPSLLTVPHTYTFYFQHQRQPEASQCKISPLTERTPWMVFLNPSLTLDCFFLCVERTTKKSSVIIKNKLGLSVLLMPKHFTLLYCKEGFVPICNGLHLLL